MEPDLVKTLMKEYFKEYEDTKKLYKSYKAGKLNPKKVEKLKNDIDVIKKKVNFLLEQMNEKINAVNEIQDYDKKIYEQYISLRDSLKSISEEINMIDKEVKGGENGGTTTQTWGCSNNKD